MVDIKTAKKDKNKVKSQALVIWIWFRLYAFSKVLFVTWTANYGGSS